MIKVAVEKSSEKKHLIKLTYFCCPSVTIVIIAFVILCRSQLYYL